MLPAATPGPAGATRPPPAPIDDTAARWANYYHGLGWRLCAIPTGTKGPRERGWPARDVPDRHWLARPAEGMGAILGPSGLVSLDLDDVAASRLALAAVGLDLDTLLSGALLVQGNPRRLRGLFAAPGGELSRKALAWPPREAGGKPVTVFELRAGPVQDCLPPTLHPGTGRPYTWLRAPWEVAAPPALPATLLELWQGWDAWKTALSAACPWAPPPVPQGRTWTPPAGTGARVIDAFNAAHDPAALLEAHGYRPTGEGRWIAPASASGLAGVVRLESGKIYSHHAADPLADGQAHDSFDLYTLLEHRGDFTTAVRAAAALLGIQHPPPGPRPVGPELDAPPNAWPEPLPLAAAIPPEPYPTDALPAALRAAVEEAWRFAQAPLPLVATAALSALSLAGQPLADVRRASNLHGPASLYLLAIASSGERKSTLDGIFLSGIRAWEADQAAALEPELKAHRAALSAWEAEVAGIRARITQLAKVGKEASEWKGVLRRLEEHRPAPPPIPRLVFVDATPEALAYSLAKGWPSAGVISSEGGMVLGSHGMGKDSALRNLALLNSLWDAAPLHIDRRSSDSFTLRGRRLTLALMIQEEALREFFERTGTLARGSGFMARFLVAWPESTQGQRLFAEPPGHWPALGAFQRRVRELLDLPLPIDERGELSPPVLDLDPEAKAAWIAFHDAIESSLGEGGELQNVRDTASKAADCAARLACLFHVFEHGPSGHIGPTAFASAARLVAWHLSEARRFFNEVALPVELADATRLDRWLLDHATRMGTDHIATREAQRLGPIRSRERLNAALECLDELNRVRQVRSERRRLIYLNPRIWEAHP